MRTKNAMQLKARISNMAKEAGIPAQAMMQSYLLERLLERLAESPWRDNVVIPQRPANEGFNTAAWDHRGTRPMALQLTHIRS